jgi:hypothetical protein
VKHSGVASNLDFTALSDTSTGPPARVYRARREMGLTAIYLVCALTLIPMGVGIASFVFLPVKIEENGGFTAGFPSGQLLLILGIASAVVMVGTVVVTIAWRMSLREWVPQLGARLPAFAAANGLLYSRNDKDPQYPGALFATGSNRRVIDHLRSTTGRFFDLGSYRFETPAGRSTVLLKFGFIAIHLDRRLPHMLLEAKGSERWADGGLPIAIDRDQTLSLEGDFDRHFTLFAPKDYEADALYVFAPDLMALLIDETGGMHVEIVDDWLFVYSPVDFDGASVEDYQRYFRIIEVVGAKTLRQTSRYEDERLEQASVASAERVVGQEGRRLREGVLTPYGRAMIPVYLAMFAIIAIIVVIANLGI